MLLRSRSTLNEDSGLESTPSRRSQISANTGLLHKSGFRMSTEAAPAQFGITRSSGLRNEFPNRIDDKNALGQA